MTLLEQYNALPKNVQALISDYITYNENLEDCRERFCRYLLVRNVLWML